MFSSLLNLRKVVPLTVACLCLCSTSLLYAPEAFAWEDPETEQIDRGADAATNSAPQSFLVLDPGDAPGHRRQLQNLMTGEIFHAEGW